MMLALSFVKPQSSPQVNKAAIWLAGIAITAVIGISGTLITGWIQERNADTGAPSVK